MTHICPKFPTRQPEVVVFLIVTPLWLHQCHLQTGVLPLSVIQKDFNMFSNEIGKTEVGFFDVTEPNFTLLYIASPYRDSNV